jgi:regulator of protease activity HflC (stomatin/prohibitin superfamily)
MKDMLLHSSPVAVMLGYLSGQCTDLGVDPTTALYTLLALLGATMIFAATLIKQAIHIVSQGEVVVIERFGVFYKLLGPGINFVVPLIDSPKRVLWQVTGETSSGKLTRSTIFVNSIDTRETLYDFPEQKVITKDNIAIKVDALLFYKVVDVKAAVYCVSNLPNAIEKLAQTTLRNVIGSMELDETLSSRDRINQTLCAVLNESLERWGAEVVAVELQEITPPPALVEAMEKEMKAERTRRAQLVVADGDRSAAVLKAQGDKAAEILRAEGEKQSQIIRAQGEAEARLEMAKAESQSIQIIKGSLGLDNPTEYLIATNYIKMLPELMKGNKEGDKVVFMPYECSGLMGSIGSLKDMLK